ncbi:thermonuclease family protein [Patescibacteria group bacterium]|nr:thermonuclease family protein [Patescibacteria group bacterium]
MTYYGQATIIMEYIFKYLAEWGLLLFFAVMGTSGQVNVPSTQGEMIQGTSTAVVVNVIDGDTIEVIIEGSSKSIPVRYIGIDTPEPYAGKVPECGSAEATLRNRELVGDKTITIVPGTDPFDQYDRMLAYVYAGEVFVNETLVAEGYASVLMIKPNTEYQTRFQERYWAAKEQQRGIFAMCE